MPNPNEYRSSRNQGRPPSARQPASSSSSSGVKGPATQPGYTANGSNNVYDYYADYFRQMGYGDLGAAASRILKSGVNNSDQFWSELRATPAYAQRFAGNIARQKAGLPMLDEAAYIQQENNYRSVLRQYGMPNGFYDDPSDFAKFIADGISPDEIGQRAALASDLVNSKDPALVSELKDMGFGKGDLAAYFLDPEKALPALQKKYDTALVGAEAERAGFANINTGFNRKLVDAGVTQDQARAAYQATARDQPTLEKLAGMEKVNFDTNGRNPRGVGVKAVVGANLGLDTEGAARVRGLVSKERSRFRGSGAGTAGLGSADAGSY